MDIDALNAERAALWTLIRDQTDQDPSTLQDLQRMESKFAQLESYRSEINAGRLEEATIRKKITERLPEYLTDFPPLPAAPSPHPSASLRADDGVGGNK